MQNHRRYIQDIEWLLRDQPQRYIEQPLELLEVGVLVCDQVLLVLKPEMNWWFHRCRHEQSPDQYIGLRIEWIRAETQFLSQVLEDILNVQIIWDLQTVVVYPGPFKLIFNTSLQFPELSHTSPRCSFPQLPWHGMSPFLYWEHVAGFWFLFRASFLVLPDTDSESSCEGCFWFSRFLAIKTSRPRFRYRRLFSRLLSWILFDMVLAFSIERKWLRENKEKIDDVKQTKKIAPFITRKTSSGQTSQRVGFLVSTYLIWILFPKLILSNNQFNAALWVLDTCLIIGLRPLMIILITASLSSKMCNWDSPW